MTFLRPGDRVLLRGWIRADAPPNTVAYASVQIGEGNDYWKPNGYNKGAEFYADGQWHQFTLDYTVPWPPLKMAFTKINVASWGATRNEIYVDDFSATIR